MAAGGCATVGAKTAGGEDVDEKKAPSLGEKKAKKRGPTARDPVTGRFLPGNKTGGRAQLPEELKEAFQRASPRALEVLVKIVNDDEAKDADRIRAAEVIFDRGYGKPRQAVDLDATSIPQVIFVGGDDIAD